MHWNELFVWFAFIGGGFCLGGIMFSQIIPGIILNKDVRLISPDHNPGAANVFASCGVPMGLLCLFFDMLKGFLPVFASVAVLNHSHMLFSVTLLAPVLGHAIAPFNRYNGGKCIATAFGELLALLPLTRAALVLAGLYIFFSTIVRIRPDRLRSMVVFGLFGAISAIVLTVQGRFALAAGCAAIASVAFLKHTRHFSAVADV